MLIAQIGHPTVVPNVGSVADPILQLVAAPDASQLLCLTASSLVVFLHRATCIRPVARWGRSSCPEPAFEKLSYAVWLVESHQILSVCDEGSRTGCFSMRASRNEIQSTPQPSPKDTPPYRKSMSRSKRFSRMFTFMSNAADREGHASPSTSGQPSDSPPTTHIKFLDKKLLESAQSFKFLERDNDLLKWLKLTTVLSFPLRIAGLIVPEKKFWPSLASPAIFALSERPCLTLIELSGQSRGIKSVLWLNELSCHTPEGMQTLTNALAKKSIAVAGCSLYAPSQTKHQANCLTALLAHNASDAASLHGFHREGDRWCTGVGLIVLCVKMNIVVVVAKDRCTLLLKYAPSEKGDPKSSRLGVLLFDSTEEPLQAFILPLRREIIFLMPAGLFVAMHIPEKWLHQPLQRTRLFRLEPSILAAARANPLNHSRRDLQIRWMACGAALAIGTSEGKENKLLIFDRFGRTVSRLDTPHPTTQCWMADDARLVVGCGTDLLLLDIFRRCGLRRDLSTSVTSIHQHRWLRSAGALTQFRERKNEPHSYSWVTFDVPLLNAKAVIRSAEPSPRNDWLLVVTHESILLGSVADEKLVNWIDVFEAGAWKTASVSDSFPPLLEGPTGWLTETIFFYSASFCLTSLDPSLVSRGAEHPLYAMVFLRIQNLNDIGVGLGFVGCTRPVAIMPSRATTLASEWRWRPSINTDVTSLPYKHLTRLFSPASTPTSFRAGTKLYEFDAPALGVFLKNGLFACYRAHDPRSSCKQSQRCSSTFLSRHSEGLWDHARLCFEVLYVCRTDLVRPLQIQFACDIFTLLIRDSESRFRCGHVCSGGISTNDIMSLLQPKPVSLTATTLVVSPPIMPESVTALVPISSKSDRIVPLHQVDIWQHEYAFRSVDGDIAAMQDNFGGSQTPSPRTKRFASVEGTALLADVSTPLQSVRSLQRSSSQKFNTSATERTEENNLYNTELVASAAGWNFVSGALARRVSLASRESSSYSSYVNSMSTGDLGSENDAKLSMGSCEEFMLQHDVVRVKADRSLIDLSKKTERTGGCASGGIEFLVQAAGETFLVKLMLQICPFSPLSKISASGSRQELSHPEDVKEAKLWTQRYGLSLVLVSRHPPAWIGEAQRERDAVIFVTSQAKTLREASECELSGGSHPSYLRVLSVPLAACELQCAMAEASACVELKDGRVSLAMLKAIFETSHSITHSLMAVTLHFLEQAVDLLKRQPALQQLPSPATIQRGLQSISDRFEILPLYIAIRLLEEWSLHSSRFIMVRLARIFEPLFSPTLIFAFSRQPLTDLVNDLIHSGKLRTAMACLVPLQQIHGLSNTRKRFGLAILMEALIKGDTAVIVDTYKFILIQHHKSGDRQSPKSSSGSKRLVPSDLENEIGVALRSSILWSIERLVEQRKWRCLITAVVALRLNLPKWLRETTQSFKAKWSQMPPNENFDQIVASLRNAFVIAERRVTLVQCMRLDKLSLMEERQEGPSLERRRRTIYQREHLVTDWALHLLFASSVVTDLHLLTAAIACASSDFYHEEKRIITFNS